MLHLKFMTFVMSLVDKANDGCLTLDEISESMMEFSPDYFTDVNEAVEKAQEDGRITVMEAINIVSSVVT